MYKFHVTIDTIHELMSAKPSPEGEGAYSTALIAVP